MSRLRLLGGLLGGRPTRHWVEQLATVDDMSAAGDVASPGRYEKHDQISDLARLCDPAKRVGVESRGLRAGKDAGNDIGVGLAGCHADDSDPSACPLQG